MGGWRVFLSLNLIEVVNGLTISAWGSDFRTRGPWPPPAGIRAARKYGESKKKKISSQ